MDELDETLNFENMFKYTEILDIQRLVYDVYRTARPHTVFLSFFLFFNFFFTFSSAHCHSNCSRPICMFVSLTTSFHRKFTRRFVLCCPIDKR